MVSTPKNARNGKKPRVRARKGRLCSWRKCKNFAGNYKGNPLQECVVHRKRMRCLGKTSDGSQCKVRVPLAITNVCNEHEGSDIGCRLLDLSNELLLQISGETMPEISTIPLPQKMEKYDERLPPMNASFGQTCRRLYHIQTPLLCRKPYTIRIHDDHQDMLEEQQTATGSVESVWKKFKNVQTVRFDIHITKQRVCLTSIWRQTICIRNYLRSFQLDPDTHRIQVDFMLYNLSVERIWPFIRLLLTSTDSFNGPKAVGSLYHNNHLEFGGNSEDKTFANFDTWLTRQSE
jgi:hypothetical protein